MVAFSIVTSSLDLSELILDNFLRFSDLYIKIEPRLTKIEVGIN